MEEENDILVIPFPVTDKLHESDVFLQNSSLSPDSLFTPISSSHATHHDGIKTVILLSYVVISDYAFRLNWTWTSAVER